MNGNEAAIRATGLRKSYGDVHAVDGVDLEVRRGEVFALLGPNGAGKTTTIEILEGYRRRDVGDVVVLGTDPEHSNPAWRSRIGVVVQSTTEADQVTVGEMIDHFALYYPNPRDPGEVRSMVGLDEKRNTRIHKLSGGQRRRLDVALGILGRPELVFLDEPTTGFDPRARRQFWGVIEMLAGEGTTVLLTTHYLEEAEALANRVAVISRGRIVATGSPAELGGRGQGLATVRWQHDGVVREEETAEPTKLVLQLSEQFDGEVPGLSVRRPTLEDVYLSLIGEDNEAYAEEGQAAISAGTTHNGTDLNGDAS